MATIPNNLPPEAQQWVRDIEARIAKNESAANSGDVTDTAQNRTLQIAQSGINQLATQQAVQSKLVTYANTPSYMNDWIISSLVTLTGAGGIGGAGTTYTQQILEQTATFSAPSWTNFVNLFVFAQFSVQTIRSTTGAPINATINPGITVYGGGAVSPGNILVRTSTAALQTVPYNNTTTSGQQFNAYTAAAAGSGAPNSGDFIVTPTFTGTVPGGCSAVIDVRYSVSATFIPPQ